MVKNGLNLNSPFQITFWIFFYNLCIEILIFAMPLVDKYVHNTVWIDTSYFCNWKAFLTAECPFLKTAAAAAIELQKAHVSIQTVLCTY